VWNEAASEKNIMIATSKYNKTHTPGGHQQVLTSTKVLITVLSPRFVSDLMKATTHALRPIADAGAVSATAPAQIVGSESFVTPFV
jgi:hypothetical protein